MNNTCLKDSYDILTDIYRDGAYANAKMKSVTNKRIAKLVYGVLDKHYELDYIVDTLAQRSVKPFLKPLLYLGIYSVKYLDTPLNVVLNETSEVLSAMGKGGLKPFVNAILSNAARGEYEFPKKSDRRYLEVKYNMPSFLVGMFRKDYPNNFEEIINARVPGKVHVRLNKGVDEKVILTADPNAEKSLTGYFTDNNREISLLNFEGKLTYMSLTSTLAAESIVRAGKIKTVLDCCAAPGGKSVYLAQNGCDVTACDIYPHRVDLINAYAKRMKTPLKAMTADSTVYNVQWAEKFDAVLVDAPCSGMGVVGRRKDVIFNKTYEQIVDLSVLQKKILSNAARYVKKSGLLIYSTCTVFHMENGDVVKDFLKENSGFSLSKIPLPYENDGEIQFLPDGKGTEGFYLCHLKRN